MNYYLRHLFEYDRSRSQAGFGSKLEQRLRIENISKDELWDRMERADPTPNKQYVNWLIKAFQEGNSTESLSSIGNTKLIKYDTLKKKKLLKPEHTDISKIKNLIDLMKVVNQYELPKKKLIDRGKYKEHLKTDTVRIIEIFDLAAALYYGQGTKWCTSADEDNKFRSYIRRGPIFVILPLKPTYVGEKYQFWYDKKDFIEYELKDERDKEFFYSNLKSKFPDIIEFFNDLILERIPTIKLYRFFTFIVDPSEKVQVAVVSKDSYLIQHIKNPSERVQLAAVKQWGDVIQYIDNPSEKIKLAAVSQSGHAIQYIDDPSEEVQLAAVSQNGHVIAHIDEPSEEVKLAAISQENYAIKYIINPSEKLQLAAVSRNGYAIQHIKNPSEKVQLTAVTQDGFAIQFIDNPSEKIQLAAIKQNKDSIKYIENPAKKIIGLSKR